VLSDSPPAAVATIAASTSGSAWSSSLVRLERSANPVDRSSRVRSSS